MSMGIAKEPGSSREKRLQLLTGTGCNGDPRALLGE
jgi:hypothetical protein